MIAFWVNRFRWKIKIPSLEETDVGLWLRISIGHQSFGGHHLFSDVGFLVKFIVTLLLVSFWLSFAHHLGAGVPNIKPADQACPSSLNHVLECVGVCVRCPAHSNEPQTPNLILGSPPELPCTLRCNMNHLNMILLACRLGPSKTF